MNNINDKTIIIKPISIRFYLNFLKQLISEINNSNMNNNYNNNVYEKMKNNIFVNIQKFDNKIKLFRKYILYLLVKKHYLKTDSQKQQLILDKNKGVLEQKNNIYQFFIRLKKSIYSLKDTKYNNQKKKEYIMMIFDILKNYLNVNYRDIKIAKKLFIERGNQFNSSRYKIFYKERKDSINNIELFDHKKTKLFIMILDILKNYLNINHRDIKIAKKSFIERKLGKQTNSSKYKIFYIERKDEINKKDLFDHRKTKLFMTLTTIILPFAYLFNYLNVNQKDYSLIQPTIIH